MLTHTGQLGSDYINANYMPGWRRENEYIAAQAPVPSTVADFWRMVWETNSAVLVMVTREVEMGRVKSHKYWPEPSSTIQFGQLAITADKYEQQNDEYGIRRLHITNSATGEQRPIAQFDFFSWPDQGVPPTPSGLIRFVLDVRHEIELARANNCGGPAIVHCSAGIGRTGTFIALNLLMQRLDALGSIDIASAVAYLRCHRAGSVQTLDQYRFVYDAMLTYYRANPQRVTQRAAPAVASPNASMLAAYRGASDTGANMSALDGPEMDDPEYLIRALATMWHEK
jgi:protein tyrosine phosphatase